LPIVFAPDAAARPNAGAALSIAGLKIASLVLTVVVLGRWVIPGALERIEKTRSRELFTLAVLVLALGIAVGSAKVFGVSMARGAFLAGLAVGRSEFAARAALDAVPMRDAFAVLFFVSVGMLFDPRSLVESPLAILAVLGVVLVVKPLAALITIRILGVPLPTAAPVGAAFSQIGEFSFILGSVARGLGLINDAGWNAVVAASMLSIVLNPFLYNWARRAFSAAAGSTPARTPTRPEIDPTRCLLVGYGPVGKVVRRLLQDRGADITVIDLNLDSIRRVRADGLRAIYGDVLRPGTLEEAGIETAGSLILSADIEEAAEVVRQARLLNPKLRVLVRCAHLRDAAGLRRAGADIVAAGEAEVGVALAEAVTAGDEPDLRKSVEQRDAIRTRLYNASAIES
jgi:CPA2 family monovalent cation:H+ antiporter-2